MKSRHNKNIPVVEQLLEAAHRNYSVLIERRQAFSRCGVQADDLPEDVALMAFALLGDHERAKLLKELESSWAPLRSKGLARGNISDVATPELRLLAHALPVIDAVDDIWQRLHATTEAPHAPHGVFRCATRVQGFWGQEARLNFAAQDVAYMLIAPDAIFSLNSALLAGEPSGKCAGSFAFPIDDGEITFTLLHENGGVYRHVVRSVVEEGR